MDKSLTAQLAVLFKAADDLQSGRLQTWVHRRAGPPIKRYALNRVKSVLGPDMRMSNFARPGRPVTARVSYDVKGDDLLIRFLPKGMFRIVFEGNRYGGGPANPSPYVKTEAAAPDIWEDQLAVEWARRVRS